MDDDGPRQRRHSRQRGLGRADILDAAEFVFATHGYHEASLREIAERAEYSVGALYGFFSSKDEIYNECLHRRGGQFMAGMREIFTQATSPSDQLHALIDFQVTFFHDHPHFARLIIRGGFSLPSTAEPPDDKELRDNVQAAQGLQVDLVRRGQAAGDFRAGVPDILARMISGLVSAQQTVELENPELACERELLHRVIDAALAAR